MKNKIKKSKSVKSLKYMEEKSKKAVLKNIVKFTRKPLYQGLFLNEVAAEKETLAQVFCKMFKNTFHIEHLY